MNIPLLEPAARWDTTEVFGRGTVLLGSSLGDPLFAPKAIKESGSCCVIFDLGPLVPGVDFPLSIFNLMFQSDRFYVK